MVGSPDNVLSYLAMAFVVVMTGCGSVLTLRAGIASESSMLRGWIRLWLVAIALVVGMLLINIFIGQLSPANLF